MYDLSKGESVSRTRPFTLNSITATSGSTVWFEWKFEDHVISTPAEQGLRINSPYAGQNLLEDLGRRRAAHAVLLLRKGTAEPSIRTHGPFRTGSPLESPSTSTLFTFRL